MFRKSEKRFYKSIVTTETIMITLSSKKQITTFWTDIWSQPTIHNKTAKWKYTENEQYTHTRARAYQTEHQNYNNIIEIQKTIKKTHSWKAPEVDDIHNYW